MCFPDSTKKAIAYTFHQTPTQSEMGYTLGQTQQETENTSNYDEEQEEKGWTRKFPGENLANKCPITYRISCMIIVVGIGMQSQDVKTCN